MLINDATCQRVVVQRPQACQPSIPCQPPVPCEPQPPVSCQYSLFFPLRAELCTFSPPPSHRGTCIPWSRTPLPDLHLFIGHQHTNFLTCLAPRMFEISPPSKPVGAGNVQGLSKNVTVMTVAINWQVPPTTAWLHVFYRQWIDGLWLSSRGHSTYCTSVRQSNIACGGCSLCSRLASSLLLNRQRNWCLQTGTWTKNIGTALKRESIYACENWLGLL